MGCASSKDTAATSADEKGDGPGAEATADKRGARFTVDISNQQLTVFPQATHAVQPKKLIARNNQLTRTHAEFAKEYASLEDIDLSSNRFTKIPEVLSQLPRLTRVDISYNAFAKSGACDVVPSLSKLQTLVCANVGFKLLPPPLLASRTLTSLDLSRNVGLNLAKIPLERLASLKSLSMAYCEASGPPPAGLKTTKLTSLNISGNPLLELSDPRGFGNLHKSLTELIADDMRWVELPRTVCTLGALTTLSIRSNPLEHLSGIGFITSLTSIDVSSCGLTALPDDIDQAERLTTLIADGNRLGLPAATSSFAVDPSAPRGVHTQFAGYGRLSTMHSLERLSVAQSLPLPTEFFIAASGASRLHSVNWVVDADTPPLLPLCFVALTGLGEVNRLPCTLLELNADVSRNRLLASVIPKSQIHGSGGSALAVSSSQTISSPSGTASPSSPNGTLASGSGGLTVVPTRWMQEPIFAVIHFESWLRQIDSTRNAIGVNGFAGAARRYRIAFAAAMQHVEASARSPRLAPAGAGTAAATADSKDKNAVKPIGSQQDGYFALGPSATSNNRTGAAPPLSPQATTLDLIQPLGPLVAPLDVAVVHLALSLKRFAMTRHAGVVQYGDQPPTPPGVGAAFWSQPCPADITADGSCAQRWRAAVLASCATLPVNERNAAADWCPWKNPMEIMDADDTAGSDDDLAALGLTDTDIKRVFGLAAAVANAPQNVATERTAQTYVMLLAAAAVHSESATTRIFLSLEHQLSMILHAFDSDAFVADMNAAGLRNVSRQAPGRATDYFESGDAALGRTAALWENLFDQPFRAGRPGIVSCWA